MTASRGPGAREPASATSKALVVVPTYNERDNLARVVPRVLEQGPRFHVLVVDDASPDGTGAIADRLAAESERVHMLHRKAKQGIGPAYLAGFRWGLREGFQAFLQMDADLSHPPDKLPALLRECDAGNVAVGSRYHGSEFAAEDWPLSRVLLSRSGSVYARLATGLPVRDATGGFNGFGRDVLERVGLDKIRSRGYSFQIELKFRAWRAGFPLVEVPFVFAQRQKGKSKMSLRIVAEASWRALQLRFLALAGRL